MPRRRKNIARDGDISNDAPNCWWEVRDAAGELVCLTIYRRGTREVLRRLSLATA